MQDQGRPLRDVKYISLSNNAPSREESADVDAFVRYRVKCDRYLFFFQQKLQREMEGDVSGTTPLCGNPPPIPFPPLSFFFAAFRSFDPKLSQHLFGKFSRWLAQIATSVGRRWKRATESSPLGLGERRKEAGRMVRPKEGGRMKGREGASGWAGASLTNAISRCGCGIIFRPSGVILYRLYRKLVRRLIRFGDCRKEGSRVAALRANRFPFSLSLFLGVASFPLMATAFVIDGASARWKTDTEGTGLIFAATL